jgi:hypothetical protein
MRPYLEKIHHKKRLGGVAQVVECLLSYALSPNPSATKVEKKKAKRICEHLEHRASLPPLLSGSSV